MIRIYAAIAAVGFLVAAYSYHNHKIRSEAVTKERARVSEEVKKFDAKAKAARRSVPSGNGDDVLARWYRD